MPKKRKSFAKFQAASLSSLEDNTAFTNIFPGSGARSITDIINLQMAEMSTHIADLSQNSFLDTASGYYLDLIGSLFNVNRYRPSSYNVFSTDKVIKFYTKGVSTLQNIMNSNYIPSGTKISTIDGSVQMTVLENAFFNPTDTFVFASASLATTKSADLGPNQLVSHDLANSSLYVTNTSRILYDAYVESDSSFRNRVASASTANEGPNESRIVNTIIGFNDVSSIDIRQGVSGSGSYDVYLVPTGNRISQFTLNKATAALAGVTGFGISFNIREFDYIPIKMEVAVRFLNETSSAIKGSIFNAIEARIQNIIGNLRPGDRLSMSKIASEAISTSTQITSAEVVYLCVNKKVQAIQDLTLKDDELFVPDEDELNPIMVRQ